MGLILTSRRLLPAPVAAIELLLFEPKQRKSSVFKRFRGVTDAIGSTSVVRRVAIMFRGRVSHTGQSRNFLLRPTTEILNFFLYGLTLSGAAFALSTRMIVN